MDLLLQSGDGDATSDVGDGENKSDEPPDAANILLVKVFRAEAARDEGAHYDPEATFGQSYIVNAPETFPSTKEMLKAHPVPGGETLGWQIDLAKESDKDDSDAIFVGSIQNYISAREMNGFVGKQESKVSLEPIFNNVQNSRAVRSQTKYNEDLVLASRAAHGFEVLPKKLDRLKSKLPMEMLFADMKCDPAKNTLLETDIELTPEITAELNESQQSSVRMAVKSKVSVIVGPPGTGKSRTLAALIAYLILAKEERVAACAVQNQAVNELLAACLLMWRSLRPNDPAPFVRFFSEGMIAKQYEANDQEALGMECHIQSLRLELANKKQIQYESFLQGVRELEAHGRILSLDLQEAYSKQAKTLTDEVLKVRKVLFVTLATSSAPTLFKEDVNGEAVKYYQASTIVCDEAGTVLRPFLLIACMSLVAAHIGLANGGIGPVIKSSDAQAIWSEMYLSSVIRRKFPSKMLNRQFRMHDELYAHLIYCIYKGFMIHSARKTKDVMNGGSPFLTDLQREPIRATTNDGDSYVLNSFLHFVDVDGQQEKKHNGSSKNVKEALAIDAMVRALIARGVERKKIGVMTGYKAQRLELKRLAKANGWGDIKILCTVDASQGGQMEYVFFSLVTTEPHLPHFMGQRSRANVGTSRQQEALYIVGRKSFWWKRPMIAGRPFNRIHMHRILSFMARRAQQVGRAFVVHREGVAPSPNNDLPELEVDLAKMTLAVEADDATAIIEDPADDATATIEVPAHEGSSAAANKLEVAEQALQDAKEQAASAIQEKEEDLAKMVKEMEAAGDEGRFAEEKRRLAEIAALKEDQLDVLRHLEEEVTFQKTMELMADEEDNASES
ncbi:MAG: hypothetical protein Q9204_002665 [Flavoplaca sp. TL-2023a]